MDSYRLSDDEVKDLYRSLAYRAEVTSDLKYHTQLAQEVKPFVRLDRLEAYLDENNISTEVQLEILETYSGTGDHSEYLVQWTARLQKE